MKQKNPYAKEKYDTFGDFMSDNNKMSTYEMDDAKNEGVNYSFYEKTKHKKKIRSKKKDFVAGLNLRGF